MLQVEGMSPGLYVLRITGVEGCTDRAPCMIKMFARPPNLYA